MSVNECQWVSMSVNECDTLHHTASHCITLHHTASHCNTLRRIVTHCCNTLILLGLLRKSGVRPVFVWQDSFVCVTNLIRMSQLGTWSVVKKTCVCHDAFIHVIWCIHMCDMTHSCMCHDSFIRVTWRIHMIVVSF